jgi:hypothetical protein
MEGYKEAVHALKGSAGYIGASRLHYACYFIQKAFVEGEFQTMNDYYPLLIETAIEVRVHIRIILAEKDSIASFIDNYYYIET